jgi:hypothetical protein
MLLGGGGPRMTRFAAEHAEVIGFVPRSLPGGGLDPAEFSGHAFDEKVTVLERYERWGLSYLTCFEEDLDLFAPLVTMLTGC